MDLHQYDSPLLDTKALEYITELSDDAIIFFCNCVDHIDRDEAQFFTGGARQQWLLCPSYNLEIQIVTGAFVFAV